MPAVSNEIISRFKDFWDGRNADVLMNVVYNKDKKSAADAGLMKPWMEGSAGWLFARAVLRANETGSLGAVREALDVIEFNLEREGYAAEGFPDVSLNTGAGCVAAFITGYARFYSETVWFELERPWPYEKILAFPFNHTTPFAETTLEAVRIAAERFAGRAVVSPLDLGGLADVLSSLRRTDGFFYDMIDNPNEVKEALRVVRGIWKNFHDRMAAILAEANGGLHSSWTRTLSDTLYYPSQCDACAMISPAMFDEFIWPTLNEEFNDYDKTLYHLDGSGEIPHLETLCSNPALRVIQWVPEPALCQHDESYLPLYKKIIGLGRKITFNGFKGTREDLKKFLKILPREAFYITIWANDYDDAMRWLEAAGR